MRTVGLALVASMLCLGAGLASPFLEFLLLRHLPSRYSSFVEQLGPLNSQAWPFAAALGGAAWGIVTARLAGYEPKWKFAVATGISMFLSLFIVTSGLLAEALNRLNRPEVSVARWFGQMLLAGTAIVAGSVGAGLGLALSNWRLTLRLGLGGAAAAVLAGGVSYMLMDAAGFRIGAANPSMVKITLVEFFAAAGAGGTVLVSMVRRHIGSLEHREETAD